MGIVASLAVGPMLLDIARDEEVRAIERKRLQKLKETPGHGFVLGDVDLEFIKKMSLQPNKRECPCFGGSGVDRNNCKYHEDVERIYLTGAYKNKYKALWNETGPKTTLENNFFIINQNNNRRKIQSAYPNVRFKSKSGNFGDLERIYNNYQENNESNTKMTTFNKLNSTSNSSIIKKEINARYS